MGFALVPPAVVLFAGQSIANRPGRNVPFGPSDQATRAPAAIMVKADARRPPAPGDPIGDDSLTTARYAGRVRDEMRAARLSEQG